MIKEYAQSHNFDKTSVMAVLHACLQKCLHLFSTIEKLEYLNHSKNPDKPIKPRKSCYTSQFHLLATFIIRSNERLDLLDWQNSYKIKRKPPRSIMGSDLLQFDNRSLRFWIIICAYKVNDQIDYKQNISNFVNYVHYILEIIHVFNVIRAGHTYVVWYP